jgi:hypothetical protein
MKKVKLLLTLLTLLIVGTLLGCSGTTKSPDVSDGIRKSLDLPVYAAASRPGCTGCTTLSEGESMIGGCMPAI